MDMKKILILGGLLLVALFHTERAEACTRVVYQGPQSTTATGRTMDWKSDPESRLWIFPRGMRRRGAAGPQSLKWHSKYGSVVTSAYDICTTDGMNEEGLVANLLWLSESEYPSYDPRRPALSVSIWAQYVLDNFATVDEVVAAHAAGNFDVLSDRMPDGSRMATLHLSVSDASGDCAVFEYIDGKLRIHHNRAYNVLTNSPIFEQQLALDDYWQQIGGLVFLPGTNRAADRFVRASFYTNAVPKVADSALAVATTFSIVRNISVPLGLTLAGAAAAEHAASTTEIAANESPEISSTRWRTVADQKNRVYYFESTLHPEVLRIDLSRIDFSANGAAMQLTTGKSAMDPAAHYDTQPAANDRFSAATPFTFYGVGGESTAAR